jgi:hypothetical protein
MSACPQRSQRAWTGSRQTWASQERSGRQQSGSWSSVPTRRASACAAAAREQSKKSASAFLTPQKALAIFWGVDARERDAEEATVSDTTLRSLERAHASDPLAWRPLLAAYKRAGMESEALVMLEQTEERVIEAGRGLARAAQHEALMGATDRPAQAAMCRNAREVLALSDARVALENDMALRPAKGKVA